MKGASKTGGLELGIELNSGKRDMERTIKDGIFIRNNFLIEKNECQVILHLPLDICETLKTYISRDKEFGGILTINKYEKIYGEAWETLGYPLEETEGEIAPNYVVKPPINGPINWHTHRYFK